MYKGENSVYEICEVGFVASYVAGFVVFVGQLDYGPRRERILRN